MIPAMDTSPPVAAEIAARLAAAGWTVRRLRGKGGFSGSVAEALLGKGPGLPSLENADRALGLLGRRLADKRDQSRKPVDPEG